MLETPCCNNLILVGHPVQETTFNSPYQENGSAIYASIHLWLGAIYGLVLNKKTLHDFDFINLATIKSVKNLESLIHYEFNDKKILMNALIQSTFCYEFKHLNYSF
jgi:hypothetical protein